MKTIKGLFKANKQTIGYKVCLATLTKAALIALELKEAGIKSEQIKFSKEGILKK